MKPSPNMKVHTCEKRVINIIREKALSYKCVRQKGYLEKRMADGGIALDSNCNCEVDWSSETNLKQNARDAKCWDVNNQYITLHYKILLGPKVEEQGPYEHTKQKPSFWNVFHHIFPISSVSLYCWHKIQFQLRNV